MSIGAGLHKLPGASFFEKPSMKITATIIIVEIIPRIEVYDRRESGRKTIGINLGTIIRGRNT